MTRCSRCRKQLSVTKEAHKVNDTLYCSKECAISELTNEFVMNAKELAIEAYNEGVTIVPIVDTCTVCGKALSECTTILAAAGALYCSRECGIREFAEVHDGAAEEVFNMFAEEINPRDIGIGGDIDEQNE